LTIALIFDGGVAEDDTACGVDIGAVTLPSAFCFLVSCDNSLTDDSSSSSSSSGSIIFRVCFCTRNAIYF